MSDVYHGKSYYIKDNLALDNCISSREDLLDNTDINYIYETFLKKKEPVIFLSNDISESYKYQNYELILFGILPCGSKTTVLIKGIYPYIDIEANQNIDNIDNIIDIKNLLSSNNIEYNNIKIIIGKDFMKYSHTNKKYIRVYFKCLKYRDECYKLCVKLNKNTYSNNSSAYYRVVAREYKLNLASWNIIKNYKFATSKLYKTKYTLEVDISDIREFNEEIYPNIDSNLIKFDKTIVCCFDIEMCPGKEGDFPSGLNPDDHIFMIGVTLHFCKSPESIINICIVSKDCEPQDNLYTLVCPDEKMVLLTFSYIIKKFQPDFITEFNGSGFDWPAIVDKVQYYKLSSIFLQNLSIFRLSENHLSNGTISNFYYTDKRIKITGDTNPVLSRNIKTRGFIPFDTMIIFKQLEPTAERHSLNHCLKLCNLDSKDDLSISELFRIYRKGTATEMKKVAHYCYVDCKSIQSMLVQRNVIQDRREIAIISYTSLYDGFIYANGLKIRNLLMSIGFENNLMFNTILKKNDNDKDITEKFPGALVLNPIKGVVAPMFNLKEFLEVNNISYTSEEYKEMICYLDEYYQTIFIEKDINKLVDNIPNDHIYNYIKYVSINENKYPVSGLDFSSLYPSIIMAYNLSPEYLITDKEYMLEVKAMGKSLHSISFEFNKKQIEAWTVRHDNVKSNIGLIPQILIDLFNRRKEIKKTMSQYEKQKDDMEKNNLDYKSNPDYHNIVFQYNYFNSKQKALKVFMNTFYGEMGNNLSCVFSLEIAGAVTTMGRYNLQLAKSFVEDKLKVKTYYGDTDSLYISCNSNNYKELDYKYYTDTINKEEYVTELIKKTFELIKEYQYLVNNMLEKDNGTHYLKMSYEEVLYPVVFLGKKKYYGIPHIGIVNFKPNKLFIRGLEVIKRTTSEVAKNIGMDIMWSSVSITNLLSLRELVLIGIERYFNTKWPIESFIRNAAYNPNKNNIQVHTFIKRMHQINYPEIPEVGIRFNYVIVKKYPYTYDVKGRQTKLSIGDKMEFIERVRQENMEIDLLHYFNNEITGQLARLLSYDLEFDTYIPSASDLEAFDEKQLLSNKDDTIFKNCKKYIIDISKKNANVFENKGTIYKKLYSKVESSINHHVVYKKEMKRMMCLLPSKIEDNSNLIASYIDKICLIAKQDRFITNNARNIITKLRHSGVSIRTLKLLYSNNKNSLNSMITRQLNTLIKDQMNTFEQYITTNDLYNKLCNIHQSNINNIVMYIRNKVNLNSICDNNINIASIDDIIKEDEINSIIKDGGQYISIDTAHMAYIINCTISLIAKYKMIYTNLKIIEEVDILYDKRVKLINPPSDYSYTKII